MIKKIFDVMNLLTISLILGLFGNIISSFATDFSALEVFCVPVPPITQQIELYREAYAPHHHSEFDVEKTEVKGLVPLVEIAHSYVAQLFPPEDSRNTTLANFWAETQEDIANGKLTIPYFKMMNIRLAFLLTQKEGLSPFAEKSDLYGLKRLYSSDWKKPESYRDILTMYPSPFCFQAILYHKKGVFNINILLEQLLHIQPLGLAAFAEPGRSVHGGLIRDPATLLIHDFVHWATYVESMESSEGNSKFWLTLHGLARKIYDARILEDRIIPVGLFFMLHELEADVDDIFEMTHYSDQVESARALLTRWVEESKELVGNSSDAELLFSLKFLKLNEMLRQKSPILKDFKLTKWKIDETDKEDTYKIAFDIKKKQDHCVFGQGTATLYLCQQDPFTCMAHVKGINLAATENAEVKGETIKSVLDEIGQSMEDMRKETTLSPSTLFEFSFADYVKLLNYAYQEEKFSSQNTPQEIKQGVKTFLDLFYHSAESLLTEHGSRH